MKDLKSSIKTCYSRLLSCRVVPHTLMILVLLSCGEGSGDPTSGGVGGATDTPSLSDLTPRVLFKDIEADPKVVFTNTGEGSLTNCTVSPSLPSGLDVSVTEDKTTCEISGTPSELSGEADYEVTATNSAGSSSATVNISVLELTAPSLTDAVIAVIAGQAVSQVDEASGEEVFGAIPLVNIASGGALDSCSVTALTLYHQVC